MVYLLNKATQIAMILLIVLVVVAAIVFVYYFLTKKKRSMQSINEENIAEVSFDKKDTREYVKNIEDIRDDMIITDGGHRFIAALKCTGFDFFFEPTERQLATVSGMYSFSNTITKPVSYRQYSKPVDLEYTLKRHQGALDERNEELFHVQEDIRDMETNLKRDSNRLNASEVQLYENEIAAAKKKERALRFRCFHLEDEIRAISRYTGSGVDPETVETWIFDWTYNPYDFSYDMKSEEVYYRAIKELYSIGQTKIHALANCGVRARRCTTDDLIEMCRWYSSPVSAERYKLSDIKNSSYFDDITASDPYAQARERALKEIEEEAQIAFLQSMKNEQDALRREAVDRGAAVQSREIVHAEKEEQAGEKVADSVAYEKNKKTPVAGKDTASAKNPVKESVRKEAPARERSAGRMVSGRRPIVRANMDTGGLRGVQKSTRQRDQDLIGEE